MRGEREEVGENNGVRQDPFVPSFASSLSLGLLPPFRGSFERGREIERDVRYRLPLLLFPLLPSPLHIHGGANLGLEVDLAPLCAATFIAVDVQPRADHARRSHHGSSARIAARLVSHQGRGGGGDDGDWMEMSADAKQSPFTRGRRARGPLRRPSG